MNPTLRGLCFLFACIASISGACAPRDFFHFQKDNSESVFEWTELAPSADSRVVYVSNGGSDAADGYSASTAKATIEEAMTLMRDGFPDWMLLEKGSSWVINLDWTKSGRSTSEPMVLNSYGEGRRPIIDGQSYAGLISPSFEHVAFVGLEFISSTYDPNDASTSGHAVLFQGDSVNDILFEDLYVHDMHHGMAIQKSGTSMTEPLPITNIRIRGCVFENIYNTDVSSAGNPAGIYVDATDGFLLEGNVFYNVGLVPTAVNSSAFGAHGLRATTSTRNMVIRGNAFIVGGTAVELDGSIATVEDNYFHKLSLALEWGLSDVSSTNEVRDGGAQGVVRHNVVHDALDHPSHLAGRGIRVDNVIQGIFEENILFSKVSENIDEGSALEVARFVGASNLTIQSNIIYEWRGNISVRTAPINNIQFLNNHFQNTQPRSSSPWILELPTAQESAWSSVGNRFLNTITPESQDFSQGDLAAYKAAVGDTTSVDEQVLYPDPNRTPARYRDHIEGLPSGASTLDDFVSRLLAQSRENWDPRYSAPALNKWIRDGFGR